ncbi:MAG: substrate-binding domain-containing protein, partial [Spirochaetia bacterium]|nr:substrate-binding domain-containing protein [Spirochaetia bacterium]
KGLAHNERVRIWKEWMTARGQKVDKDMCLVHESFIHLDPKAGKARLKAFVNKVTAVIATDDAYLPELHRSLLGLGLKVPSQMSLAGINNTTVNQKSILPATSIEISPFRHGAFCFDTLFQLLTGRIDRVVESAPIELIERDSARRPRKKMKVI